MTPKQKNNLLIAEFMNGEIFCREKENGKKESGFFDCKFEIYTPDIEVGGVTDQWRFQDTNITGEGGSQGLYFHQEWNWLMPVVEKIEDEGHRITLMQIQSSLYTTIINTIKDEIPYQLEITEKFAISLIKRTRFDATYKAVVEYIKWKNKKS